MPIQKFKAIYFPSKSKESASKTLTLAFGNNDLVFEQIRSLSSHELRTLLGFQYFEDAQLAAEKEGMALNTFCLWILRSRIKDENVIQSTQLILPNIGVTENKEKLNPIHATFRGGANEPLHLWYPYLEGYSPKFVQSIIKTVAPSAKYLYDPFGGTGTTPITGMLEGIKTYYSEVNPLLQFLIETKLFAYQIGGIKKSALIKDIFDLSINIAKTIDQAPSDNVLRQYYYDVFGDSVFFDSSTFELVLKSRKALDQIIINNPALGKIASIAVVSSLLSSSNLIRSGDVRYRTKEELKKKTVFIDEVVRRLIMMANDLEKIDTYSGEAPVFLCEDARNLDTLPKTDFDLVITSPPYLNGTNYFRNTKIELWFLRCIQSKSDLAGFRYKAVTSGINDVTVGKTNIPAPLVAQEVVKILEGSAYDSRIPRMVAGYFADMETIFKRLRKHLSKDAKIAIDIGDSVYAGVHIPVQNIISGLLEDDGYKLEQEITLRKRLSRDKTELSQVLLVFNYKGNKSAKKNSINKPKWSKDWDDLKKNLPFREMPFSKRNWGHPLHSLCSYQGKMKPSLAHFLVKTFVMRGGRMLDPFAGVGTIPFEAALQGIMSYGFDISPAALAISKGKVEQANSEECLLTVNKLKEYIQSNEPMKSEFLSAQSIKFNGSIPEYFEPNTLKEILLARRYFLQNPITNSSEALVLASLLHILHGNRPYALSRRSHPITPFKPTGSFEYKSLISNLYDKVDRSLETEKPEGYIAGKIFNQDATSWWTQEVNNLDAIITSPPFYDSTRFHVGNWMRLWFCGWEKQDFSEKPLAFVDERQKQNFDIYVPIFRQARERLSGNGVFVIHLGESKKCDMAKELSVIAQQWFKVEDIFSEDVTDLELHGIRDKGTVTKHQFLVLS